MKLLIGTPSSRDWKFEFSISMLNLTNYLGRKGVNGQPCKVDMHLLAAASLLPAARQAIFDHAVSGGFTHLFMVDDDMKFPRDIIDRFAKHDVDFVAANYVSKGDNGRPTAMGAGVTIHSAGVTGIKEVGWVGLGCCLLKMTDVIKAIPPPHFEVRWLPDRNAYLGEDLEFCEKMREKGVKIYVDHDVSHDIGHIGDKTWSEKDHAGSRVPEPSNSG